MHRVLVFVAVGWYLFGPIWCCLINNCPQGGKRSMMDLDTARRHQKKGLHWLRRPDVTCKPRYTFASEDGVCVGPLCCDSSVTPGRDNAKCSLDYEACGSSEELIQQYALCLSPGLVCDKNTQKCCNYYDRRCFDSIMCRHKDTPAENNTGQLNLSEYENLSDRQSYEENLS